MEIPTEKINSILVEYTPKVITAILLLIVGFWVIKKISKFITRSLMKSGMDETFSSFLTSVANAALKILLILSVAGQLGVNTTSFIAIISALAIGIGMALNGSIGHIASGVMLMIFKPFKVGDLVTIGSGHTGSVEAINAFNTTLATLDNKRVIIANSNVTSNTIINISGQETIGVELTFGIGYNDNIDDARKIILEVGARCPHILKTPAQGVVVAELADNSVNLATRPFCKSENYWAVFFFMNEEVKKAFDKENISIPYPQLDLHYNPAEN